MSASLTELLTQKKELERQIQAARSSAKAEAIAQIRKLMAEHELTTGDIAAKFTAKELRGSGKKVAPKYRDPISGASWSGRGLKPRWLTAAMAGGKSLDDFAV